jgi:HSP20 family protein
MRLLLLAVEAFCAEGHTGQVNANYDKGLLKIRMAKKAEAKPKQIKVSVGSEKILDAKVHGKAA